MSYILTINTKIQNNIIYYIAYIMWYVFKYLLITYKYLIKFIRIFYKNKDINNTNIIDFYKNNKLIKIVNEKDLYFELLPQYDYIIQKYNCNNRILSKIFYDNTSEILKNLRSLEPYTNLFIYINLLIANNKIDITNILNNNENNFYVIDSIIFNKEFMDWLLIYKLKLNLDDYKIIILDNNFNEITIHNNQYIKFNNNTYEIITI
jgi:hypothetical protein